MFDGSSNHLVSPPQRISFSNKNLARMPEGKHFFHHFQNLVVYVFSITLVGENNSLKQLWHKQFTFWVNKTSNVPKKCLLLLSNRLDCTVWLRARMGARWIRNHYFKKKIRRRQSIPKKRSSSKNYFFMRVCSKIDVLQNSKFGFFACLPKF